MTYRYSIVGALLSLMAAVLVASVMGQEPPSGPVAAIGLEPYFGSPPTGVAEQPVMYDLSTFSLRNTSTRGSTYCATLKVTSPAQNCNSSCCKASIRNIMIDTFDSCRISSTFVFVTVNGNRTSFNFTYGGPNNTTLHITKLGLGPNDNGAEICINLKKNAAGQGCATVQELCKPPTDAPIGTCSVTLMDTSAKCESVATTGEEGIHRACVNYEIFPAPDVKFPYIIPEDRCNAWADRVFDDLKGMAIQGSGGDVMPCAPTRVVCTPTRASTCMDFSSIKDLAAAGPNLVDSVNYWFWSFGDVCDPYMLQYVRDVSVTGPAGKPLFPQARRTVAFVCPEPTWPADNCDRKPGATPFQASPYMTQQPGRTATTSLFCFTTVVLPANDPTSTCGRTKTIHKVKFWVNANATTRENANETVRSKVKAVGLQPADSSVMTFQAVSWGPLNAETLKVTPLDWTAAQANGGRICLEVSNRITIDELCQDESGDDSCWVALIDDFSYCCPTYNASL